MTFQGQLTSLNNISLFALISKLLPKILLLSDVELPRDA